MLRSWLRAMRDRLVPVDSLRHEIRGLKESDKARRGAFDKFEKRLVRHVEQGQRDAASVADRLRTLEEQVKSRLERQEVLLRRLAYLVGNGSSAGKPVTARVKSVDPKEGSSTGGSTLNRMAQVPTSVWHLDRCPVCGGAESTVACESNKFLLMGGAPDADAVRYDYALCHDCGVLAARHRPVGQRFRYLIENFVEATGKEAGGREVANPLLNPYPLTDDDRAQLRGLIARGVFVSEHAGVSKQEFLSGALRDRLENSVHVEVLGSLVPMAGARVLEVRPRAGSILAALKRLYGADVVGLPIWESQRFIIKELYGIESPGVIDFVEFTIDDPRPFDLIVCNHMLTHAIDPRAFFAEIRAHLKPGGHLYLYNEPDDAEFLKRGQSMIATLNPFHMQAFDRGSLVRALAANGFETLFTFSRDLTHLCLARESAAERMEAMDDKERARRLRLYANARLRSLLKLPAEARERLTVDWQAVTDEAIARGVATMDGGRLRLRSAE